MKQILSIIIISFLLISIACSNGKLEEKGFQVSTASEENESEDNNGINKDSLKFITKPSNVLLTGIPNVRLTTIYKVNYNKRDQTTFIGSNSFYYNNSESDEAIGNNWNNNIMPGFKATYGYNMVNISHYDIAINKQTKFFEKPVLIKTLYYPTPTFDTLKNKGVLRNYFMVTVYNDDTNKDGFINLRDLRRCYLFNINGEKQKALIPENYSVMKSEYDPANDFMFVFAQLDENNNGKQDDLEPIHIFWID